MTCDCHVDSAIGARDPLPVELAGRVRLGDDRHVVIEVSGGNPVEMVPVMMGQHDEIQFRELLNGQRRLGQPLGGQAHANVSPVTAVQEIGIGKDAEPGDLDQSGGGPDEGDLPGSADRAGRGVRELQRRSLVHDSGPLQTKRLIWRLA
jgi:hypothetical protein